MDTASVYYVNPLPLYFILKGDTVYTLVDGGPVFPIHTSAPDNPDLFIDLNNYVKKQVSDVHLGKGAVDLVFIIDKEGYIRDVTIKKSARENGAAPNVAARMGFYSLQGDSRTSSIYSCNQRREGCQFSKKLDGKI